MAVSHLFQALGVNGTLALGDTVVIEVDIYKDGVLYSPTVTAAEWQLKDQLADSDAESHMTKTLGSGVLVSGSQATVTITAANWAGGQITETGVWLWALKLQEASGTITTVAAGTLAITRTAVVSL